MAYTLHFIETRMAMIEYNEVTPGVVIIKDGEPWECLSSNIMRKQQRKPVNQTKLKNLITGRVTEYNFAGSEKAEEAEIEKKDAKYLYNNRGEWWFCEPNDPSKRFKLEETVLGTGAKFLKPNTIITTLLFNEKTIGVRLPIKMELKVTEAPPAVRGDTAKGGNKVITLETGATINAPMFVNEGDVVRVNTETGEYVERV